MNEINRIINLKTTEMSKSNKEIESTSEFVAKPVLGAVALTDAEIESIIEAEEEDDDMWDEDDDCEPLGYQCNSCGNIQSEATGFGCDVCTGKCLDVWYG